MDRQCEICPYAIIESNITRFTLEMLHISLNNLYDFEYDVESNQLTISSNRTKSIISRITILNSGTLKLFENVNAFISQMTLIDVNDNEISSFAMGSYKLFVPGEIQSPILIVDEDDNSLDISASYREVNENVLSVEYHNRFRPLELPGKIHNFNEIELYGIPHGALINKSAATISEYCPEAIRIDNFNVKANTIIIGDNERNKYKALAVRYQTNKKFHYLFTTSEREIFDNSKAELRLEHQILNNSDAMQIYGILPDANIDISKLYRIPQQTMIHSIDLFADKYDAINQANDIVDAKISTIFLNSDLLSKYIQFVVDYSKENSYAINFVEDIGEFQVDISSTSNRLRAIYDMSDGGNISKIKQTGILPDKSKYVVLKRRIGF